MGTQKIPTDEQLKTILRAGGKLAELSDEALGVSSDQRDSLFILSFVGAIRELERAWNPNRLPFGNATRSVIALSGWPEPQKLWRGLRLLSESRDAIILALNLEEITVRDDVQTNGKFTLDDAPLKNIRTSMNWIESAMPKPADADGGGGAEIIDYIDLDQAAALVNRSKRTLERAQQDANKQMPLPAVQGAGGRKSEWNYAELRPWLEQEYGKKLPDRPPHVSAR